MSVNDLLEQRGLVVTPHHFLLTFDFTDDQMINTKPDTEDMGTLFSGPARTSLNHTNLGYTVFILYTVYCFYVDRVHVCFHLECVSIHALTIQTSGGQCLGDWTN